LTFSGGDDSNVTGVVACGSDSSIDNIWDSGGTVEAWINVTEAGQRAMEV